MDIMELGAIGELVGGVAVIASLLYVGLQVQQSNRIAKAESARAQIYAYNAEFLSPLSDPDQMQLFRDGVRDFAALDDNSKAVFHAHVMKVFNLGHMDFTLKRQGMITEYTSSSYQAWCARIIRTPGLDEWWDGTKRALPAAYVQFLETLRDETEGALTVTDAVVWYGSPDPVREEA